MVYAWGLFLFIFLFTVPKQETKEEKVWTEPTESVSKQDKKKDVKVKRRYRIKDVQKTN